MKLSVPLAHYLKRRLANHSPGVTSDDQQQQANCGVFLRSQVFPWFSKIQASDFVRSGTSCIAKPFRRNSLSESTVHIRLIGNSQHLRQSRPDERILPATGNKRTTV